MNTSFTASEFTLRNVRRDFPEWHRGRPSYALWALNVDCVSVKSRLNAAQHHLGKLLLDDYIRQSHITLSLCGFPCDVPQAPDDFGMDSLRTQIAALQRARPQPFEIDIGDLASFTSAPYLTVNDEGGHIAKLRNCLALGDADAANGSYTPHVTVGLYADAWPTSEVQVRLDSFAFDAPLRLRITSASWVSYAAAEIGGPLTTLVNYDFVSGTTSSQVAWVGQAAGDLGRIELAG